MLSGNRVRPVVFGRLLWAFGALMAAGHVSAQTDQVTYICTGYPVESGKELVVTVRGDDGSTQKANVSKPGGAYYLAMARLKTGVSYEVEYQLAGVVKHVHSPVVADRVSPLRPIIKEIQFDKVPKMKDGPKGKLPLLAQAKGVNASTDGEPVFTVTTSDGAFVKSTRPMTKGYGLVHVEPGHAYTLTYRIGGRTFSRTASVPNDGSVPPKWELAEEQAPPPNPDPPCAPGEPCDDGDPQTKKDKVLADCTCRGIPEQCTPGAPCEDGDPETIGEKYNRRCECTGGVQKPDCKGVPGGPDVQGEPCDDGDPQTVNDVWAVNCKCMGTSLEEDCLGVPGGTAKQGTRCDDGDPTTVEDKYDANCLCHGYKAKQTMPLIKSDSQANRCSNLHVLASAKPRPEWNVGDVDVMKVKVDPGVYTGAPNSQQGLEEKGASLNGLVYVNDSLRLLLSSPDECFKITGINPDQSIRSSDTLVFTWSITAEKTPSKLKDDRTTLEVNSYTLDCSTGRWTINPTNTLTFEVTVTEPFDPIKWLQDHIAAIGGILGGIAVIIGYFKDWFGGLFRKKTKEEGA